MAFTYPGMTVETRSLQRGSSRILFEGIFAAGGITLSQVTNMTGLEYYIVQNWVKRKYVAPPRKKMYSKEQFARIVIINMLRETLHIEPICDLIQIIGGDIEDASDDLIRDDELYHMYVDMLAEGGFNISDSKSVLQSAEAAAADFKERSPGAKKKLVRILQVMAYAHSASMMRDAAKEMLASLQ